MSSRYRSRLGCHPVRVVVLGLAAVLLATSCAARNKVEGAEQEQESTSGDAGAPSGPSSATFGEIDSPVW
ncbi:MAG: hypothetical protein M5U19_19915 [Microthrixaceae bacterium]|nr:hypothetical protein [Microthrixaceae bacterium]